MPNNIEIVLLQKLINALRIGFAIKSISKGKRGHWPLLVGCPLCKTAEMKIY